VNSGEEYSVDVTLSHLEQSLEFNFSPVTSLGEPPSYARIRCQSLSNGDTYEAEAPQPLTQFTLPVEAGSYECTFETEESFLLSPNPLFITVLPGQSALATIRVYARDSTLRVELVNESSQPAVIDPDESGFLSCRSTIEGQIVSFYQPIEANASTGEISLVGGLAYSCEVGGILGYHAAILHIPARTEPTVTRTPTLHPKVSTIRLQLSGPGGVAPTDLPQSASAVVTCSDDDGELPEISKYTSVSASEVLLQVPVGRWSCAISEIAGFHKRKTPHTSVFTKAGEITDYPIILEAQQHSLTLVLQDQNGASISVPESASQAYARCVGSEEDLWRSLLPGSSSISMELVGGDTYKCSVRNIAGYMDSSVSINMPRQGASSHNVKLATSPESLKILIKRANPQGAYTSIQPISLFARGSAADRFVTRLSLLSGFSESIIPLSAPLSARVEAEIQGEATTIYRGTISSGQHQSGSIDVLPSDSTLLVKLVDTSGRQIPISGTIRALVEAESDIFSYRATIGFTAGLATANLRGGAMYRVTLLPSAQGEHFYYQGRSFSLTTPHKYVSVDASQSKEVSFALAEETEIITINGLASGGFLTLFHDSLFGSAARNIDIVGPRTEVRAQPGSHSLVYRAGMSALPQTVSFSVGGGEANEITLKSYKPDSLVSVTPRFTSPFRGTISCNAFSDEGVALLPKSSHRTDQAIQLALSTSSPNWTIDCSAWSSDTLKRYHGRSPHIPNPSSTETVAIDLKEVGAVDEEIVTSETSEQLSLHSVTGVSVLAPKYAFGHSNIVSVALDSRVNAPSSTSIHPLKAFRISARGTQDEWITPIKSLIVEVKLEEDMAVYGYSDLLGYFPLQAQSTDPEITPAGQLALHSLAVPPDLVNDGLIVLAKKQSGGESKDIPKTSPPPNPDRDMTAPRELWLRSKKISRTRWALRASWSATNGAADYYRVLLIGKKGRVIRVVEVPIKGARTTAFYQLLPGPYTVKVQSVSRGRDSAYISASKSLPRR